MHAGLVEAIAATILGAVRQRCRTRYTANLMSIAPKSMWSAGSAMLHSVYDQPDAVLGRRPVLRLCLRAYELIRIGVSRKPGGKGVLDRHRQGSAKPSPRYAPPRWRSRRARDG